jgi:replication factor C small subunit
MSTLKTAVWTELYRPDCFDDLIFENKESLELYLKDKASIPSLLFHSNSPGTGKTSTAKLIAKASGSDILTINASDERGIDTIRDKIKLFAQSMSSLEGSKRCVFLDEADGLTKQAQESMKAIMETYANNCFFILSCNDISKIIEPIRKGRTFTIDFSKPPKDQIVKRLLYINKKESINIKEDEIVKLVDNNYPDIRSMIMALHVAKIEKKTVLVDIFSYQDMMKAIKEKNVKHVYESVYSGRLDIQGFVRYYFEKLFQVSDKVSLERLSRVAFLLADIEKNWALGVNLEIVFIANVLEIMKGTSSNDK